MNKFAVPEWKSTLFVEILSLFGSVVCIVKIEALFLNGVQDIINLVDYKTVEIIHQLICFLSWHLWLFQRCFRTFHGRRTKPRFNFILWKFIFPSSNDEVFNKLVSKHLFDMLVMGIIELRVSRLDWLDYYFWPNILHQRLPNHSSLMHSIRSFFRIVFAL